MKRRAFLGTGLGLAAGGAAPPAVAQGQVSLSLVTDRADVAAPLAARIAAMSGGRITVDVTSSGREAAAGFLDTVSSGDADMYLTRQDAFTGRNPAFGLFAAMPGGMTASELESWIVVADGRILWDTLSGEVGIKCFMAGDDGAMPLWSRAPITGLADLSAGPVGSTGLGLGLLTEMGIAETVDIMSGTDLDGLVALEGLSAAQMADAGLLSDYPHMTTPNAGRPSAMLSVGVNISRWSALSDVDQFVLERAIMAEHGAYRAAAMHRNVVAIREAGAAVIAHDMPQEIWEAQIAASNAVMTAMFDAGDAAADAADGYLYFIADVAGWSEIGETAYFLGRRKALTQ